MYLEHWGLRCRPFDPSADPRFFYPADSQQAALLRLRYVVENRQGLAVIGGESGLGKSCALSYLLRQLPSKFQPRLQITFPALSLDAFLGYIAVEITGDIAAAASPDGALRRLERSLREGAQSGQHAVIVVDDAHLLIDSPVLTGLRMLTNLVHDELPMISFILSGQPEIFPALERWNDLNDRVAARSVLKRLDLPQSAAYLRHRITAAGGDPALFDEAAVAAIHEQAQGIPRRINRLADLALLIGYAEERTTIGVEEISAVVAELALA